MLANLLTRHRYLTQAMPTLGSRNLANGPTSAELRLQARGATVFAAELLRLYQRPLSRLSSLMGMDEADMLRFILNQYDDPQLVGGLNDGLNRYLRDGFSLGGQMALNAMNQSGLFNLTNEAVLARLETYANEMVAISGDRSITRTTARELVGAILRGREALEAAELAIYLDEYGQARSEVRGTIIAENESVATTRSGMVMTFWRSGVRQLIYRLSRREDGAQSCGCDAYNGLLMDADKIPLGAQIPRHIGCNCYYEPVLGLGSLFSWTGS